VGIGIPVVPNSALKLELLVLMITFVQKNTYISRRTANGRTYPLIIGGRGTRAQIKDPEKVT